MKIGVILCAWKATKRKLNNRPEKRILPVNHMSVAYPLDTQPLLSDTDLTSPPEPKIAKRGGLKVARRRGLS